MKATDINFKCLSIVFMTVMTVTCSNPRENFSSIARQANIHPLYQGTVIPYNIAPLNFMLREDGSRFLVRFAVAGKDSFDVSSKNGKVLIPPRKWKKLLYANRGEQMHVSIFVKKTSGWERYYPLRFTISREPIDTWLAYRLIEPGYEAWNSKMGIYQRNLENFKELPIMLNQLTGGSCINCHSFRQNDPQTMLFHVRQQHAGTLVLKDGKISKIDTRNPDMISAAVYPRWHPDGRYVAFSFNTTRQVFHSTHTNKVEVFDYESDLIILDTETNIIFTNDLISSEQYFETFPEWSPDGKYLYFCSAEARSMPQEYDSLKYSLLRIPFDAQSGSFGSRLDTLVSAEHTGKSVAMARVSPDGKYVVFCMSNYGTFPIWHRENDLYLMDLDTKEFKNMEEINSNQSDSYHSWSSNGRWLVFGSRRMDGTFTHPYISYFDEDGNAHAPFILPQKDPRHYDFSLKSYNIPEFITGKVMASPRQFAKTAKGKAINN